MDGSEWSWMVVDGGGCWGCGTSGVLQGSGGWHFTVGLYTLGGLITRSGDTILSFPLLQSVVWSAGLSDHH